MPKFKKLSSFLISILFVLIFIFTAKVHAGSGDWMKVDQWNAEYMQMFDGECEKLSQSLKLSKDLGSSLLFAGNTCSMPELSFLSKANGGDVGVGVVGQEGIGPSMWIFKDPDKAKEALGKMIEQFKQMNKEAEVEYASQNPSVKTTVLEDLETDTPTGNGGKLFKFSTLSEQSVEGTLISQDEAKYYGALSNQFYSLGKCVVEIKGFASSNTSGGLEAGKNTLDQKMTEFTDKSVEGLEQVCGEGAVSAGSSFNFPLLNLGTLILVITIILVLFLFKSGFHLPLIIVIAVIGVLISLYNFGMLNLGLFTKSATELSQTKLSPGSSWLSQVDLTKCDQIAKRSKLSDVIVIGVENKGTYKCIAGAKEIDGTIGYLDRDGDIKIRLNYLGIDAIFDDQGMIDSKVSDTRQYGNPAPGNAPTALTSSKYWDKKYADVFEEVEFLADIPGIIAGLSDGTSVIAKKGTFDTSEGKGAYIMFTGKDTYVFNQYTSYAKAKKGHCVISMEITSEVDPKAYNAENPRDTDVNIGVDAGKTKTEKLTIELMQDMVKAIGNVCGS